MTYRLFFLLSIAMCFSQFVFAQDQINKNNYNIPPGDILHKKFTVTDYSYKLSEIPASASKVTESNFLVYWEGINLDALKIADPKRYQYFITAENYYQSLSLKVKSTFSIDELWHIYMFDQTLKNKLQTIN